jgi:hemerythrin
MSNFEWSPEWSLGVPTMDDSHKALLEHFAQVAAATDAEFGDGLHALIAAIECDFREEEELMEAIDFPLLQSHREQHARVLSALHGVVPEAKKGNYADARYALSLWPKWFEFHMMTMDAALAVALDTAGQSIKSGT